jgi:predicted DNA-binding transcriptional regulator AlpA
MHTAETTSGDALLRETDAANFLKLSIRTLQAWRSSGVGPAFVRAGRAVRYRQSDLINWIEANVVCPKSGAG